MVRKKKKIWTEEVHLQYGRKFPFTDVYPKGTILYPKMVDYVSYFNVLGQRIGSMQSGG